LRGVGAELDGGLIGGGAEVSEEVTNLLLAGVDDRSGGCGVDGGSHILTKLLEAAAQLLQEGVRRQGGFGRHDLLLMTGLSADAIGLFSRVSLSA
jgi:hypothetical protein